MKRCPAFGHGSAYELRGAMPFGMFRLEHLTLMIEEILRDEAKTDPAWRVALLRYFNPVGAHALYRPGGDGKVEGATGLRR